ncbi:hypothetical protein INR49_032782, partial [Caranx melampygus]
MNTLLNRTDLHDSKHPNKTEPEDLLNNFKDDKYNAILNTIGEKTNDDDNSDDDNNNVYVGTNLIVARPGSEGHAEYRAMDNV